MIPLPLNDFEQGLDFADALHLASSSRAGRFATFDKKLIKLAEKLTDIELVLAKCFVSRRAPRGLRSAD